VTIALPKSQFMTVRVTAADRDEAKRRATNQARGDGHRNFAVMLCRKETKQDSGNRPLPPIEGKPA
jgi:hypothetical protein